MIRRGFSENRYPKYVDKCICGSCILESVVEGLGAISIIISTIEPHYF